MIFGLIVFGSRPRTKVLGQVQYTCPMCRQYSYHVAVRSQNWFTLYWIPVIPLKKRNISRCNFCGYQEQVMIRRLESGFHSPVRGSD